MLIILFQCASSLLRRYFENKNRGGLLAFNNQLKAPRYFDPEFKDHYDDEIYEYYDEIHQFEELHKGAWQRIFPAEDDTLDYNVFFDGAKKAWHDVAGQKFRTKDYSQGVNAGDERKSPSKAQKLEQMEPRVRFKNYSVGPIFDDANKDSPEPEFDSRPAISPSTQK